MHLHPHASKLWLLSLVRRTGSLSAAALEAKVSSSAISQALAHLESLVGHALLVRTNRGVHPTPEGHALLDALEPALKALEGFDPASLRAAKVPRRLRLGAYESIAIDLLPRFVPLLRARWPDMAVDIVIARSRVLLERCRRGDLDLVFVADATHGPNLHVRPYATDTYGVFAAKSLLVGQGMADIVKAVGFGALPLDDKHHTRSFRRFLRSLSPAVRPTLETESFEVLLALIRGGALAGALPLRVAARASAEVRRLDGPPGEQPSVRRAAADVGRHDLALACHESFSKPLFDALLELTRGEWVSEA